MPAIVGLLTDDVLGARRETGDRAAYERAFSAVDADPGELLVVVTDDEQRVVATCQLSLLPGLSRGGVIRLQIEGVRVAVSERSSGLGAALLDWAHRWGRQRGASLAQLASDRQRPEAHRFYESLGYTASHVGYKRAL